MVKRMRESQDGRKPLLESGHCFCHLPWTLIDSKDGQTSYVKCGRSKQDMKAGRRGCTLFCGEDEWTTIQSTVNQHFPEGFLFEDDWPECSHHLKVRLSTKKDRSGCFFNCRMGLYDPDVPCDFCQWLPTSKTKASKKEGSIKKRKL